LLQATGPLSSFCPPSTSIPHLSHLTRLDVSSAALDHIYDTSFSSQIDA
jgi:hypothetical protein